MYTHKYTFVHFHDEEPEWIVSYMNSVDRCNTDNLYDTLIYTLQCIQNVSSIPVLWRNRLVCFWAGRRGDAIEVAVGSCAVVETAGAAHRMRRGWMVVISSGENRVGK